MWSLGTQISSNDVRTKIEMVQNNPLLACENPDRTEQPFEVIGLVPVEIVLWTLGLVMTVGARDAQCGRLKPHFRPTQGRNR